MGGGHGCCNCNSNFPLLSPDEKTDAAAASACDCDHNYGETAAAIPVTRPLVEPSAPAHDPDPALSADFLAPPALRPQQQQQHQNHHRHRTLAAARMWVRFRFVIIIAGLCFAFLKRGGRNGHGHGCYYSFCNNGTSSSTVAAAPPPRSERAEAEDPLLPPRSAARALNPDADFASPHHHQHHGDGVISWWAMFGVPRYFKIGDRDWDWDWEFQNHPVRPKMKLKKLKCKGKYHRHCKMEMELRHEDRSKSKRKR